MRYPLLRLCSIVLVLLAIVATAEEVKAQYSYKFRDSLGTYDVRFTPASKSSRYTRSHTKPLLPRTHEIRLSTSYGGTTWSGEIANTSDVEYYGDALTTPVFRGPSHRYTLTFDYGYWVNEWLSIGASVTYMAGLRNLYNSSTQARELTIHDDNLSIMPIARFAWYRRSIVQLYSSAGVGLGLNLWNRYYYGREVMTEFYCAFDFKPLGISVGRKWFGFVEVGYGSRGIVNAGFGVRINNKTR